VPAAGPFTALQNAQTGSAPAHFYRLFDFVETPSPFVGTELWYAPNPFASIGKPNRPIAPFDQIFPLPMEPPSIPTAADMLRPPYNRLSRFRDPGRINLNTIFDLPVFEGMMKGYGPQDPSIDAGAFWNKFVLSRQGHEGQPANLFPTDYANVFRSAASADLGPPEAFVPRIKRDGVDVTLLRSDFDTGTFAQLPQPLFSYKPGAATEVAYANSRRSSQDRYHPIQRLGNIAGTHSNVFAIWITVGYFEVLPWPGGVDAVHPDGYQLGPEMGSDSGNISLHLEFFIFDRSIPVAYDPLPASPTWPFQPGEGHNIERAILVRRFIE
jgi:hypothetical protein